MTLNVNDSFARELAQALAERTAETMTAAVIQSLRERLDRVERKRQSASAEELMAIGRRCAAGLRGKSVSHGDLLYDERGLPR